MAGLGSVQPNRLDVSAKTKVWDYTSATLRCDTPIIGGDAVNKDYVDSSVSVWGSITGVLANQLDLQAALDLKYDATNPSGYISDLSGFTTTDLAEGTNLYFTDARAITALTGENISVFNNDSGYLTSAVTSIKKTGEVALTGAVTFSEGTNITLTQVGQDITITSAGGGGMIYPGAGIALSTGSAWDTSIVDNSANWNTAYGWGDWSGEGFITGAQVPANETDPVFTAWLAVPPNISIFTNDSGFITDLSGFDTGDLAEGTNLYYTQARFNTAFTAKSTTD